MQTMNFRSFMFLTFSTVVAILFVEVIDYVVLQPYIAQAQQQAAQVSKSPVARLLGL